MAGCAINGAAAASKGATITPAELAKFNLYLGAEESVRPDGLYVE